MIVTTTSGTEVFVPKTRRDMAKLADLLGGMSLVEMIQYWKLRKEVAKTDRQREFAQRMVAKVQERLAWTMGA